MQETVLYAIFDSDLGRALAAWRGAALAALLFGEDDAALLADLRRRFPAAQRLPAAADDPRIAAVQARLADPAGTFDDLALDPRGTAFQQAVWAALRGIPPGETVGYGDLARRLGRPGAARAVGGACAANPVAVAIPCHRVVAADGGLGGYRWGSARKRALLAREGVSFDRAHVPAQPVAP